MVVGHGMLRRFLGDDRGFSLIEILIALSAFFIVLFAVYTTFDTSQATYAAGEQRVDIQQNARVAMEVVGADLRLAGYGYPQATTTFDPTVSCLPGNEVAIPASITNATATSIVDYCASAGRVSVRRNNQRWRNPWW